MILNFADEIAMVEKLTGKTLDDKQSMELSMELVMLLSKGMEMEQNRIIAIIKKHAMNPLPLISRIKRPIR
jgi:hypothetical protein